VQNQWWRVMIFIPSILIVINTIFLLTAFHRDTPKWLFLVKKDKDLCEESLKRIYLRKEDVDQMIEDLQQLEEQQGNEIPLKTLFCSKKYHKRVLLACALFIGQQTSGIDVLFQYSDAIFLSDVSERKTATIYTIIIGFTQLIAGICAIFTIEHFGRRGLLIFGGVMVILCLYSLSVLYYFELFIPVFCVFLVFSFFNGISLSPLPFVIGCDLMPVKTLHYGITVNYITNFIITETFLYLKALAKLSGTMLIFAILTSIILIIIIVFFKETKGLTFSEVDCIYTDVTMNGKLIDSNTNTKTIRDITY
jgi:hypothetical protein